MTDNKDKVGFITPDNQFIYMDYSEVKKFCVEICESDENIQAFLEFKKDYTYLEAYFDFVAFKKKYIFINPLLGNRDIFLVQDKDSLYEVPSEYLKNAEISYDSIYEAYFTNPKLATFPYLNPCSDKELNLKKFFMNNFNETCVIDSNGMCLMSKTGFTNKGNHSVTERIYLNQVLINDEDILQEYKENKNMIYDPSIYPLQYLGHIRVFSTPSLSVVYEKDSLNDEGKDIVDSLCLLGYYDFTKSEEENEKKR